jgi:hypothetical protein
MNTFRILAQFLKLSGEEVEGREIQEPTEDAKVKLQRLARGALPASEQPGVFAELNRHPEWLATEIKGMRAAES